MILNKFEGRLVCSHDLFYKQRKARVRRLELIAVVFQPLNFEKNFSGKFLVRTDPEVHSKAVVAATRMGLSLNKYVEKAIEDENRIVLAQ